MAVNFENVLNAITSVKLKPTASYNETFEFCEKIVNNRVKTEHISPDVAVARTFRERLLAQISYTVFSIGCLLSVVYLAQQTKIAPLWLVLIGLLPSVVALGASAWLQRKEAAH